MQSCVLYFDSVLVTVLLERPNAATVTFRLQTFHHPVHVYRVCQYFQLTLTHNALHFIQLVYADTIKNCVSVTTLHGQMMLNAMQQPTYNAALYPGYCAKNSSIPGLPYNFGTLFASWMALLSPSLLFGVCNSFSTVWHLQQRALTSIVIIISFALQRLDSHDLAMKKQ